MEFRHEWKHELNYPDMLILRPKLDAVMQRDSHAVGGTYRIRSLYFDNLYDKALREKADGVNCREKFRIRYYNGDTSFIMLEKKSKINGLTSKVQERLTVREAQDIASGRTEWMKTSGRELVCELYTKMNTQGLAPKTIVDYTRDPFTFEAGNVRVTLDYNIRSGLLCTDFLSPDCVTVPVGDQFCILEVKWDAFLPDVIRDIVQLPGRRVTSFSKYEICRIYG